MSIRPVDPARSRIVLLGTPAYGDDALPDIPQVAANLSDLARVLTDPALGGFDERHCVTVPTGAGVEQVGDLLHAAAGEAEDLLLFYYAGHGVLGRSGELYLSLRNTRLRAPDYSALRFETVRGTFLDSPAANRVVIIDSCYSGRAIGPTLSAAEQEVLGQLEITGTYTLTSAPPNSLALVRDGEAYTAFTGRLLRLLENGSEHAGDLLSLGEIYRHLHARLRADGLPLPQQRGTATTDLLGLVRNRYRHRHRSSEPLREQALALAATAEHAARALLPDGDASCMADLAAALASVDPPWARALADQAWASAGRLANPSARGMYQYRCINAHVMLDVDSAARLASEIADDYWRARALVEVAESLAVTDRDRAVSLAQSAYRSAAPVQHVEPKVQLVGLVGRVLARADSDRALVFAESADPPTGRALVYAEIARQISDEHPHRVPGLVRKAVEALRSLDEQGRQDGLVRVATVIGSVAPDEAEGILRSFSSPGYRTYNARSEIARGLAATDPDRAETFVATGELGGYEFRALAAIARVVAATDASRASRLADLAEHAVKRINVTRRARPLADLAVQLAAVDSERAARLLTELKQFPPQEDYDAVAIAAQVAPFDPDLAITLADGIADVYQRVVALAAVVSALLTAPVDGGGPQL